jgi:tetratricopeptide (TPR) repeat protein
VARTRLTEFQKPAAKPAGPVPFPGAKKNTAGVGAPTSRVAVAFPGKPGSVQEERKGTISNIPINVPLHFLGRDDDLAAIDKALKSNNGRAAITALHGLRGVGKTTLAAAYAEQHRKDCRATWWIRAETESTMRADIVGLGVRLGWVAADAPEEPAVAAVLERLREEGDGILLVYDNAINADEIRKYLPRGGATRIIVTSNAPNWGSLAAAVEIEVWPKEIGADYLTARTGRSGELDEALGLSEIPGGLPLAHEQAAAYCERLGISIAEYRRRFEATPAKLLDAEEDAPAEYHDRLTVAKTFALAIEEAAELHPAAKPLIEYAALLAPEPIPLFLFSEAREKFGEPLASNLAGDGLDEAVAALRTFALVDRETIPDERDPLIRTDCIRLHRLVRQVAAAHRKDVALEHERRALIDALAAVYPKDVFNDPDMWPQARRLDALAVALVGKANERPKGTEENVALVLDVLGAYRRKVLAAFAEAQRLHQDALAIREQVLGAEHPGTAVSLNNLATLLQDQGDFVGARKLFERALAIDEKFYGSDHPEVATVLNNLAVLVAGQQGFKEARALYERALTISENSFDSDGPLVASILNNLGNLLLRQDGLVGARNYFERALTISEKALGSEHLDTATTLANLGAVLRAQGDLAGARPYFERALAIFDKVLGAAHPSTKIVAGNTARVLQALKRGKDAKTLRNRYGLGKATGA